MKTFEQITAKELLSKIEFTYSLWETKTEYRNQCRLVLEIAQNLFNLEGYSITEVIEELKKIVGE